MNGVFDDEAGGGRDEVAEGGAKMGVAERRDVDVAVGEGVSFAQVQVDAVSKTPEAPREGVEVRSTV